MPPFLPFMRVQLLPPDTCPDPSLGLFDGAFGRDLLRDGTGRHPPLETSMGKYVIGWLLGVPVVVLIVLYLFFG